MSWYLSTLLNGYKFNYMSLNSTSASFHAYIIQYMTSWIFVIAFLLVACDEEICT